VCVCVCMCVHVDFLFFLPEMVNKVEYIKTCQSQFSFDVPSIVAEKRVNKFKESLAESIPSWPSYSSD